jgi:hypothetical protein
MINLHFKMDRTHDRHLEGPCVMKVMVQSDSNDNLKSEGRVRRAVNVVFFGRQ